MQPSQPPSGQWQQQPYPPQQWSHPAPYPPPGWAPPPTRRRAWPWVILGCAVALIVAGAIGRAIDTAATTSPTQVAAAVAMPAPSIAPAGTAVSDGKFSFQVTNVQSGLSTIGTNEYLKRDAQGQFVEITLSITNIGSAEQTFWGRNQKLVDTQGRQFTDDTEAEMNLSQGIETDINPGNQATATVIYDIPANDQPKSMDLHDSAYSAGVGVELN